MTLRRRPGNLWVMQETTATKPIYRIDQLRKMVRHKEIESVRQLAKFAGVPVATLRQQLERNSPTMPVAAALAVAFGTGLDTFVSVLPADTSGVCETIFG